MKTIIEFATEKNCSRQTVYQAMKRGELDYTEKYGKKLLNDTAKNKSWTPQVNMRRL